MAYENVVYKYLFENLTLIGDLQFLCPDGASLLLTLSTVQMTDAPGLVRVSDCLNLDISIEDSQFDGVYMEFSGKDTTFLFRNITMTNTVRTRGRTTSAISGVFFNLIENEGSHTIEVADSHFEALEIPISYAGTRRPMAALAVDTFDTLSELKMFVTNSVFSDNKRAIDVSMKGQNSVQIVDSTFANNVGDGAGGAIRIAAHMDPGVGESSEVRKPDVYVRNCHFRSNLANTSESYREDDVYYKLWAPGSGGAIYVYVTPRSPLKVDGYVEIQDCAFVNNTGTANGGTIFISPVVLASISNCTMENGRTRDMPRARMGDVVFASSSVVVENVVITVNTAEEATPVVYYQASDLLSDKLTVTELVLTCARGFDVEQTSTSFANGLQSLQLYCTRCGGDHYSLDTSTVLVDNSGSFVDERISCHRCPYGADCSGGIVNMDNFWGGVDENGSQVNMYLCPEDYCVENDSLHVQFSSCVENRRGVLCGRCESGFSEALYGTACISDEECGLTTPASIGLLVLILVRGIVFVALLLFADEWESVVNSGIEKISPKGKAEQIQMVTNEGFLTIYFYFIQTVELVQVDIIVEPDETKNIIRAEDVLPEILLDGVNIEGEIQAASCFVPGITPVEKVALTFAYPAYAFLLLLLVYLATGLCCICRKTADKPRIMRNGTARIMLVLLELFLFTYQGIAESLLQLIQCVDVQGKSVLWIDGNVECLQNWQYAVIAITCIFVCPFFTILLFGPKVLKEKKITLGFFFFALVFPVFCFVPIILVFFGVLDHIPPFLIGLKKRTYSAKELEQKITPADEKYEMLDDSSWRRLKAVQRPVSEANPSDAADDDVDDLREAVADALVGTYRSWEEDGDDFLAGLCWEGVLNLQRLVLVVVYVFTPDVLLRQMLLCALMFFILLLQMKLKPFSGRMSNRAQTAALSVIVLIGMFNLIRATLFHAGASPQDVAYVLVIVLEWIEVVCTVFLPLLLVLAAFVAVFVKGVKNKVDDARTDTPEHSPEGSTAFVNDGYQPSPGGGTRAMIDGGRIPLEEIDPEQFTAKSPDLIPLPWRQKKYPVARKCSSSSETQFGRVPDLPPDQPTATNWRSLGD